MQSKSPENIIPDHEKLRLQKLFYYEILNSPAENTFDNISSLASEIFEVPHAGICFIEEENIFIKSQIGAAVETKRKNSPVSLAILGNDVQVISNKEFSSDNEKIKFFAVAPIQSPDGFNIGAIYVFDTVFKTPSNNQIKMLARLAEMVIDKLETRIAIRKSLSAQDDRLHVLIHDLKNPMTTISLQSELIGRISNIDEKAVLIASKINVQSKKIVDSLNEILISARKESGSFKPQKVKVDLKEILEIVTKNLALTANQKKQSFVIDIDSALEIFGDTDKLKVLFFQLLHNAIKFSDESTAIMISHQTEENLITIAIKDQGVGLSAEDLEKLFIKFARLSAIPTHKENSNGLGLTMAKMFVDMHKGKLWAESEGKNKGTTFFVQLPVK
ncbi:sensor histidine kinase [Pedobacter chinensis]|uniref:histidine kinase n=1 Tax=Pedobacter chinensis TaxID=2282421 RepID=A0A369PZ04_9SPHI|nr:HAMP domain-containing sensor histidine kinase [Pedobacter chinensis]RDC57853.1 sensor histidine kinase [Pedobacter chinensis]